MSLEPCVIPLGRVAPSPVGAMEYWPCRCGEAFSFEHSRFPSLDHVHFASQGRRGRDTSLPDLLVRKLFTCRRGIEVVRSHNNSARARKGPTAHQSSAPTGPSVMHRAATDRRMVSARWLER